MTRTLTIDIWSDIMCPWCLVGWGNLRQALATLEGEFDADIRWHAFELNPDMPAEGEDCTAHLARKYGRRFEQSHDVQVRMRDAAKTAGVSLNYEGPKPAPDAMMWNTFEAHKLLTWALEEYGTKAQTRLKLALFEAHFNQRRRIGDRDVLLDIASEAGLNREAAAAALGSEAVARKTRAEQRAAMEMNITGVPAMIVEGRFMIPGAQPPEAYVSALRRVAEKVPATA